MDLGVNGLCGPHAVARVMRENRLEAGYVTIQNLLMVVQIALEFLVSINYAKFEIAVSEFLPCFLKQFYCII